MNRSIRFKRSLARAAALLMIAALLAPCVPLLLWSISQRWLFPAVLPQEWGLRAWRYLLSPGAQLWEATATSLFIGGAVTFFSLLAGLPAGRALGLARFRGKTLVQFLVLSPAIVPSFASAMGVHVLFIRYGLADTLAGVVLVQLIPVLPYVVVILSGVFASYRVEAEEEARTLGARSWQVFCYVTLPSIRSGILAAGLFAFMISWGQYLLTLLIGGGQVLTLPILLLNFVNSGDYALASALSLVLVLPIGIILWFAARVLTGQSAALGGFGRL